MLSIELLRVSLLPVRDAYTYTSTRERRTQLEYDQTLMIASWPIVCVIVIVLVHVYDLQLQSVQLSTEYDMDVEMRACVDARESERDSRERGRLGKSRGPEEALLRFEAGICDGADLFRCQLDLESAEVLQHSILLAGCRQHAVAALHRPAEEHLRRRAFMCCCNLLHWLVCEHNCVFIVCRSRSHRIRLSVSQSQMIHVQSDASHRCTED